MKDWLPAYAAGSLRGADRDRVGAHAYPRRIDYVETLPKTTTGKVDRRTLRDRAAAEVSA